MTESRVIEGVTFKCAVLPTANSVILLIQGQKANLGCGYFSMAAAGKMKDRFAIVRGVSTIEEVLAAPVADLSPEAAAPVADLSPEAAACGVTAGMKGQEALLLMEKN